MLCFINMLVDADPYSSKKGLDKGTRGSVKPVHTVPVKIDGVDAEVGTERGMFNMRSS
jgi:hypothetical protein